MPFKDVYNLGYSPTFEVADREEITQDLNLTVNPAATAGILSGTVTSGGIGLANATVKVYDTNDNPVEHANTAGNGNYVITNLPVGSYKVTAIKTGYLLPLTTPISIQANKITTADFDLIEGTDKDLNTIYGIVRTTVGETPLQNAVVSLYTNETPPTLIVSSLTNDHGQFVLGLIPTGEYHITASRSGYYTNVTATINLTTGEFVSSDISLIVDPLANTGTISGFIYEASTGQPIANAGVLLYSVDTATGTETIIGSTLTNVSGKYLFPDVGAGTYRVKSKKQEEVVV